MGIICLSSVWQLWCHLVVVHSIISHTLPQQLLTNLQQLSDDYFLKEGDVKFGAIFHIHKFSHDPHVLCGKGFSYFPLHFGPHVIDYEVGEINKRQDLLPNITLGFVVLDDCERDIPTVPRMLQLMPLTSDQCDRNSALTVGTNFDVFGILGTTSSEATAILAAMTGFFQLPQIGVFASSDELSDKTRFPYFYRLLPPDRYQAKATIDLAKHMGWTYVSLVYIEADFGYNGNKYIQKFARENNVCIEEAYAVPFGYGDEEYDTLLRRMTTDKKAKIMIVYLFPTNIRRMLSVFKRIKPTLQSKIFFILPECFPWGMTFGLTDALGGSMHVSLPMTPMPGFLESYTSRTPWNTPYDPWLPELWEEGLNCRFNASDGIKDCTEFNSISESRRYIPDPALQRWGTAVHVLARALDAFIRDNCPEAFGDKSSLKACVKPWMLAKYVQEVEFEHKGEVVKFNSDGEWLRQYVFRQVQYNPVSGRYITRDVGTYSSAISNLTLDVSSMSWDDSPQSEVPESVCSYPCDTGQIMIQGEVICCWECYRCRENEIVNANMTKCLLCPDTTWPDDNVTSCLPIPPSYLSYSDGYGIGMLSLGIVGFTLCIISIALVLKHLDRRVIKGASPDLLLIILFGVLLACLTVPIFILKPQNAWCYMSRAGFALSCTLMFSPLLIKTLRVHQVFAASRKLQTQIHCVTRTMVNIQNVILIVLQVAMTIILGIIWPPMAVIKQPIRIEKYVELQCDLEMYGILVPLGYNMVILLLCSVYGFLTRKLPENFNESWYIFVTVCTTLFIWIAFLPTYFSAFYAFHKAVLLSLALFLNAIIVLVCIFAPKVYALFYIPDKDIKVTNYEAGTRKSEMTTDMTSGGRAEIEVTLPQTADQKTSS